MWPYAIRYELWNKNILNEKGFFYATEFEQAEEEDVRKLIFYSIIRFILLVTFFLELGTHYTVYDCVCDTFDLIDLKGGRRHHSWR